MSDLIIVTGGVCTGKTTLRRNNFSDGYTHIDASDIFLELCGDDEIDFPSVYENEMNHIGKQKAIDALQARENIVIEIIGDDESSLINLLDAIKTLNYKTRIIGVSCSIEVAIERNTNRTSDDVSAYYTQNYHINWLIEAVDEFG